MSLAVLCPMTVRLPPAATFGRPHDEVHVVSNADGTATPSTLRSLVVAVAVLGIDEIVCVAGGGPHALDDHQVARHAAGLLRDALPRTVAIHAAYTDRGATRLVRLDPHHLNHIRPPT